MLEGIQDTLHKYKILERLQISNMNLEPSIEFLQLELIRVQPTKRDIEYNQDRDQMLILWLGTSKK